MRSETLGLWALTIVAPRAEEPSSVIPGDPEALLGGGLTHPGNFMAASSLTRRAKGLDDAE